MQLHKVKVPNIDSNLTSLLTIIIYNKSRGVRFSLKYFYFVIIILCIVFQFHMNPGTSKKVFWWWVLGGLNVNLMFCFGQHLFPQNFRFGFGPSWTKKCVICSNTYLHMEGGAQFGPLALPGLSSWEVQIVHRLLLAAQSQKYCWIAII